ncbi:hypothetical protein INT48_003393 [Thamnidium elegans]|uniref:Ion transport domain-containing protein n=1 Tax=Thamnidium elegans TaxID=101142 RepID=A0A8H7SQP2_9FUNG|nr:hypothetical protein INT48_003393 [Thamnidium elegans]
MSFDEEERITIQYEDQSILEIPHIDIGDTDHDVKLLDISCNKKWIAYVTYSYNYDVERLSDGRINPETKNNIYITRRRFTAIDQETEKEELGFSGNRVLSTNLKHATLKITDHIYQNNGTYCSFLSISNDGRYVALSFYEEGYGSRHKGYINPDCLIFDMDRNFSDPQKIKCQGRAVFLNEEEKNPLAIISKNNLEIYAEFPQVKKVTCMFDLSCFYSTGLRTCPTVRKQMSYINNASWANIFRSAFYRSSDSNDMEIIITFTRHIRQNILSTPFDDNGIVRIWSILEEGARFSSFTAEKQHVMALSTGYTFAAAYVENSRSVNIYDIKSGVLMYRLKSRENSNAENFKVSHIRFCYDARYVAMSGLEGDNEVAFEVWHLESERSIHRTTKDIAPQEGTKEDIACLRRVEPFVTRELKKNRKCLKGYYTSYPGGEMTIMCVELKIDKVSEDYTVTWITNTHPQLISDFEIENGSKYPDDIRCGRINVGESEYLIRFSKRTVQLWNKVSESSESYENGLITENDTLIYIRAYKGPAYGIEYSFRDTWEIQDFNSIRYIADDISRRFLVNIKTKETSNSYHTEELFLPLDILPSVQPSSSETILRSPEKQFDYHKLESACQALHYFFTEDPDKSYINSNWKIIREKTSELIKSSISDIKNDCHFFSTINGSRTLAMLSSFEDGRNMIKIILASKAPISIFSYVRSQSEIDRNNPPKRNEYIPGISLSKPRQMANYTREEESNMPDTTEVGVYYRSSTCKPPYRKRTDTTIIAPNENALTVLIDEQSHDWYKLLFNRILLDSQSVGPSCFSALTDTLLYLEEGRKHSLLLSSSPKLSYLEVDYVKLGILDYEYQEMTKTKALQKCSIADDDYLVAHATREQIKMYKGYSLRRTQHPWMVFSSNSTREVERYARVCLIPITHFTSYGDLYENQSRHTNIKDEECESKGRRKESTFVRVALDRHINDMFQQDDIILELLLKYKWKRFARSKFILICFIHAIYYFSYCTGILFAPELYGLNLEEDIFLEHPGQIVSITFMLIALLILIIQEARQFSGKRDKLSYFFSGYNWIDMCAFVLPTFTLIQLCNNWPYFIEVCSISTLILWTHAILRLRVISHFGVTLEIIIQLSRKIAPLLLIMLLVILAFTQTYIVLLRLRPDDYFRDTFSGVFLSENSTTGDVAFGGSVEFATSSDNGFSNWFTAFYNVWLFIYGVWDPIVEGDAGSSIMVMCLSVIFSLVAVLIFFNMVIAIMSSVIEEVDSRGKKVWISHFTGS